ncbi:hypothetical protein [Desulfovibrio sp. SGI.169]|uniref:VgrG-related protein n=1 Tax=Desulfovibrio sp. SGI.169 TaxID=3420561 RepID=UPI003D07F071
MLGDYKGSLAGNLFDVRIREFDAGNMLKARKYKGDQYDAWSFRENSAAADMFARLAARSYNNPEEFIKNAAQAEWHIKSALGRKGYGPEAMAKGIADARSAVLGMSIQQAIANGDMAGAQRLLHQYGGGGRVGDGVARYESGKEGIAAIGYDENGGTSYGKYQLSSKQGSLGEFLSLLESKGGEHAEIARRLRAAGPANTGGKEGAFPAQWKKEASANPALLEEAQREYVEKTHYQPALDALPESLAARVSGSAALQEMVWSTAVQHGGGGAGKLLRRAWREGMSDDDFVRAVYAERGTRFSSSSPEVRAAVQARFKREEADILSAYKSNSAPGAAPSLFGLSPADRMKFQGWIDAGRRKQTQEANLTASAFDNQIAYGMDKGDFSPAEATISKLASLGAHKEAAELQAQLTLSKQAWAVLDGTQGLPLLEQAAAAHKSIDTLVTPDNAKDAVAMRSRVDTEIERRKKTFIDDPAGYVSALPGMQDDVDFQERTRRSLILQEKIGKGLGFMPRVLSESQAKQMRMEYDKQATPDQQLQWLQQIRQSGGEYSQQMLAEMKMPEAVMAITPVLPILPQKDAALWLSAATLKPSDIPKVDNDTKKQAEDTVANSDFMSVFYAAAQKYPTNRVLRDMAMGLENAMKNALLLGMDSKGLENAFSLVADSNCILLIPKTEGIDADDAAYAINQDRERIAQKLIADLVKEPKTPQGRNYAANLLSMVNTGTVISAGDGREAMLLDPWQGNLVLQPDGTPIRFDLHAIVKEGPHARMQKAAEENEE